MVLEPTLEKKGRRSSTGETWGNLDEFPSDESCWNETVKRKEQVSMGKRNTGSYNEKKSLSFLPPP